MRLIEQARIKGDVFAVELDAKAFPTYESFRSVLGAKQILGDTLCRELVREGVARSYARAVKPIRLMPRRFWRKGNLIVTVGKTAMVNELIAGTAFQLTYCGVGSSATNPTSGDTDLNTPISPRVAVTSAYLVSGNIATWDTFFGSSANAGTWNESGLFTAVTSGTMGNHALFSAPITKSTSNTEVVEHQWTF